MADYHENNSNSSDDETDFFGRLETDDLFEESHEQQQKRQEAQRYVQQYAQRQWGLAARQRQAVGSDRDSVMHGHIALTANKTVVFQEKQGQQAKVWDCALVLAKFLTNAAYFPEGYFMNKRVIELGCGIGVPGLAAAVLGAGEVVLTDMPGAVPWINENIMQNQSNIRGSVHALPLMWGETDDADTFKKPFDVILCSDLVYGEPKISQQLVWTIRHLSHGNTVIISAHEARFAGDRGASFFNCLQEQQFSAEEVPYRALDEMYRAENMHVHIITCTNL